MGTLPSYVYGKKPAESTAWKLLSAMGAFTPDATVILSPTSTNEEKGRLSAYVKARNAYLRTGARTPPSRDVQQIFRHAFYCRALSFSAMP